MAAAGKYQYAYGSSTAAPCVPNTGKPKAGGQVAWARHQRKQQLVQVHAVGTGGYSLCGLLHYTNSPYLGTRGHVAYATNAPVTCGACAHKLGTKAATRAKALATKAPQAAPPTSAPVAAPVAPPVPVA